MLGVGFHLALGGGTAPTWRLRLERTRFDLTRRHELAALEVTPGAATELRLADRVSWNFSTGGFHTVRH